jgi:hypothetical protein
MSNLYGQPQPTMTSGILNRFNSNKYVAGTREFVESNSLVAKFAFLILVLFAFIVIIRLFTALFSWFLAPTPDPYLIKGMIDGNQQMVIEQDPSLDMSIPILRSKDQRDGIEFTWSTWIYIDDIGYKEHQYRHIFSKGNGNLLHEGADQGINHPNNAPGLYLAKDTNELVVIMNTFNTVREEVRIGNIPIQKWISVIIRCEGNQMDVYINGVLTKRHIFTSVPKQNYGNVNVALNGGFSGNISNLRYFNYSLGTNQIQSIVDSGPNLKMKFTSPITVAKPKYLSTKWYFAGQKDGYNPQK